MHRVGADKEAKDLGKEEAFQIEISKVVRVRERIDLRATMPPPEPAEESL